MFTELNIYIFILWVTAIVSITISYMSWNKKPATGSNSLTVLMLIVSEWIISQAFQDISDNIQLKLLWHNFRFTGIALIPIAWFVLTVKYTKLDRFVNIKSIALLCLIPILSIIIIWSNGYHHLFMTNTHFERKGPITALVSTEGPWFWILVIYSYMLILWGTYLLLNEFFRQSKVYRKQTSVLLVGCMIPLVFNILFVFRIIKFPYSDITPFTFLISGSLFYHALSRYKLLDLIPVARYAVIESMKDQIMVLDNYNRIVDINPSMARFLEKDSQDIIGKSAIQILDKWFDLTEKFIRTHDSNEKITISINGSKKYYDLNISPVCDKKGVMTARLIILRDITVMENMVEELQRSRKAAEEANNAKSQFLATMSHEIRTPMNAIMGMSEILSGTKLDPQQKSYIEIIKSSADSLLTIVNDILDFSKIEAGKLKIEKVVFNIKSLLSDLEKSFALQAANKNIQLKFNIDDFLPESLIGDPVRTRQIISNLIGNAIKFTEKGWVQVDTFVQSRLIDSVAIKISVIDTGIGIPEGQIENLFERFHQVDSSTTRKYGGTGLGLAIVKHLTGMMGGCVKVESAMGKGSIFSVTLPFSVSQDKALHQSADLQIVEPFANRISVLLVEDNKTNQFLMSTILRNMNVNLDIADNGLIALKKLESNNYHIVLMDIQMPEMDGFETTAAIRVVEEQNNSHIPIIALTANAMIGDREKCLKAGMDDYLAKPVKSKELFEMIKKYTST